MSDDKPRVGTRMPPERLAEVRRRLLNAESPGEIERELSAEWLRTPRQIRKYILVARKQLAAQAETTDKGADLEISKAMLLAAFKTAKTGTTRTTAQGDTITMPDAGAMVRAAKTYAEITGAAAPQKVEHGLNDGLAGLLGEALDDTNNEGKG